MEPGTPEEECPYRRVLCAATGGRAQEGLGRWGGAERQSERPEPRRTLACQWQAMGRIEHPLLDRGRSSTPSDLRPSLATTLYHKKCRMFLSTTKGRDPVERAGTP